MSLKMPKSFRDRMVEELCLADRSMGEILDEVWAEAAKTALVSKAKVPVDEGARELGYLWALAKAVELLRSVRVADFLICVRGDKSNVLGFQASDSTWGVGAAKRYILDIDEKDRHDTRKAQREDE